MSRPAPVIAADSRTGASSAASLPRVRPSRAGLAPGAWDDPAAWGPHPEARGHRAPPTPPRTGGSPGPSTAVAGAAGLLATGAPPAVTPAVTPAAAPVSADPALLPVLAPRRDRPLTLVQRVTLMLQRLGRQGRHRTGHSRHHWSMFAPQPGPRRRSGWTRR